MAERLAQHLISRGLLPASKVDGALRLQGASKGGLDSALLEQGLVSEPGLLQALADVSGLQPVNLADFEPNLEAGAQVPRKIAERLSIAPLSVDGGTLHLAVCYPPPKEALKEVGFLLGKKLELWVAIECRVHDWNATVYDSPLAPRFERILRQLDPSRRGRSSGSHPAIGESTESVSADVLERAHQPPPEEPILLDKPRSKRRPTLEVIADPAAAKDVEDTVFITPSKYGALKIEKAFAGEDERESTSVLDLDQYADFARKATGTAASDPNLPAVKARPVPPPAVTPARSPWDDTTNPGEPEQAKLGAFRFPGGVLPPSSRKKDEKPAPPRPPPLPVQRVTAAPPPRPRISVARPAPVAVDLDEEVTRRGVPPAPRAAAPPEPITHPAVAAVSAFAQAARMPVPPARPEPTPLPKAEQPPRPTSPVVTPAPVVRRDESDFSDLRSSPGMQLPDMLPPPVPSAPPKQVQLVMSDPTPSPPPLGDQVTDSDPRQRAITAPNPLGEGGTAESVVSPLFTEPVPAMFSTPATTAPLPPAEDAGTPGAQTLVAPLPEGQADGGWQGAQQWSAPEPMAFQMPSPEEWAALPPEAQAAWWEQYQAAYALAWPPDSSAGPEGWVSTNQTPALDPGGAAGPDQAVDPRLPPEIDSWVALPPGARPLAPGAIPPPPPPPSAPSPPPSPGFTMPATVAEWTLPLARQALKRATHDRERLLDLALSFGLRAFDFCAVFAVVRGVAVGWGARGEGDDAMIRQVAIPLDVASVFRTVALTRGSYIGPLPNDALTQHYLALMGRTPRTLFCWPLEVKGRLVAILYGDCGGRPISQRKLSDFLLFCNELPAAFHELLVFRKQRMGERAAFSAEESGDARPSGIREAETQVGAPSVDAGPDQGILRDLLGLLTGPDAADRASAMTELMKTPEASARALAEVFPGPTAWSRLPVTELPEADELGPVPGALARLGRAGAAALAPLLDVPDSDVRYLALLTAGSLPYPELVDGVVRGLFDVEPDISSAARAASTGLRGMLKFDAQIPDLRRELIARDPMNRSLAARALGVLRDRGAVSGLIDLVDDPDELCAQAAVESLREITRQNHGGSHDAWDAWWQQAQGQRRVEWLIDALGSPDFDARLAAIDELARASGDNLGYFADGTVGERAIAAQRWRELLAQRPELEV